MWVKAGDIIGRKERDTKGRKGYTQIVEWFWDIKVGCIKGLLARFPFPVPLNSFPLHVARCFLLSLLLGEHRRGGRTRSRSGSTLNYTLPRQHDEIGFSRKIGLGKYSTAARGRIKPRILPGCQGPEGPRYSRLNRLRSGDAMMACPFHEKLEWISSGTC